MSEENSDKRKSPPTVKKRKLSFFAGIVGGIIAGAIFGDVGVGLAIGIALWLMTALVEKKGPS
jgi:hypothetical protein